jgi:hypothetical protein
MIHTCPDCGLVHDHGAPQTNSDVEIARINAEAAVRQAEIAARADRHVADVQADAAVDATEAVADAEVDAAEIEAETAVDVAEAVAEVVSEEPDAAPLVLDAPAGEPEPEDAPPPAEDTAPSAPRKPRGLGMW